jgi:hypothetical protein
MYSFAQNGIAIISAWNTMAFTQNERNLFLGLTPYKCALNYPVVLDLSVC